MIYCHFLRSCGGMKQKDEILRVNKLVKSEILQPAPGILVNQFMTPPTDSLSRNLCTSSKEKTSPRAEWQPSGLARYIRLVTHSIEKKYRSRRLATSCQCPCGARIVPTLPMRLDMPSKLLLHNSSGITEWVFLNLYFLKMLNTKSHEVISRPVYSALKLLK